MTPRKKALSQLARLALNAASESTTDKQIEASKLVAVAIENELPELAALAMHHARFLEETRDHLKQLDDELFKYNS